MPPIKDDFKSYALKRIHQIAADYERNLFNLDFFIFSKKDSQPVEQPHHKRDTTMIY